MARLLGVDISIVPKDMVLEPMLGDLYNDEKNGLVPDTRWKRRELEQSWYLETVIWYRTGYIQTTHLSNDCTNCKWRI